MTVVEGPGTRADGRPHAADRPRLADRLRRAAWLRPLALYAASRLLVLLAAGVGTLVASGPAALTQGPWPARESTGLAVVDALLRWDSAWYLWIAEDGYGLDSLDGRNAFFPLLPLVVRAVAALPGLGVVDAGLLVGHATGATATVLVWLLGRRLSGPAAADRMAALFAFFPGSVVLSMVYAEGLLLSLAAGTLLALDRRRWLLAGLLAALATACRPTGGAVAVACAWAALVAVARPVDGRREWRALVAPALAPAGLLAFFAYLAARTGDPLAWFTTQREVWGERLALDGQLDRVTTVLAHPVDTPGGPNTWIPVLGLVVVAAAAVALAAWRPPGTLVAYAVAVVALVLVSATIGARPRMVLTAFPLVMALGHVLRGTAFPAVLGLAAGLGAVVTVLSVATTSGTP